MIHLGGGSRNGVNFAGGSLNAPTTLNSVSGYVRIRSREDSLSSSYRNHLDGEGVEGHAESSLQKANVSMDFSNIAAASHANNH